MPAAPDNYAIFLSPLPKNGLGRMACGKFCKVDSLAVATRISHNYQVLLDHGNRIIIPQGNSKVDTHK